MDSRLRRITDNLASYYRANPHRLVKDYFNIVLAPFQKIIIYMMDRSTMFYFIASRGLGKTFLIGIYCCIRAILYPGSKICLTAGKLGQSMEIIDKIITEIIPRSPSLQKEVVVTRGSYKTKLGTNMGISFLNGSYIKVVAATDNARGNRANILVVDEARKVDQDTISTVLTKFLNIPRRPKYLDKPEYKHLMERNKQIYTTSAYTTEHWIYEACKGVMASMLDDTKQHCIFGLPYPIAIKEGISMREEIEDQLYEAGYNEATWNMEMESLFFGSMGKNSFLDFSSMSSARSIKTPMLPSNLLEKTPIKDLSIKPKAEKHLRIISADIALMSSGKHQNDAASIFVADLTPRDNRYHCAFVYAETKEGQLTEELALRIRTLFNEYDADYIVLDCSGNGLGVYDAMVRPLVDQKTGQRYEPLSCCNNPEMAKRCKYPEAPKVIWAIKATPEFNSDSAWKLREGFNSGRISLLKDEVAGRERLENIKAFNDLPTEYEKVKMELPYIETTLLIDEIINLSFEQNGKYIKATRSYGKRKDRYSSASYCYHVVTILEEGLNTRKKKFNINESGLLYRAPKNMERR